MPNSPRQERKALDRFGTHRLFCEKIPKLKEIGGYSVPVALLILWDAADAYTGVAVMSMRELARRLGCQPATALKALRVLLALKLIRPVDGKNGKRKAGRWQVDHLLKHSDEPKK